MEFEGDRAEQLLPGRPRRVSADGTEDVTEDVVVQTDRGQVWMSWPPLAWEAILDSAKIDELVRVLGLAREGATRDGRSKR